MHSKPSVSPARRRLVTPLAVGLGTVLGIIAMTGATATASALEPAARAGELSAVAYAPAVGAALAAPDAIAEIQAAAATAVEVGEDAIDDAETVTADIADSGLELGVDTTIDTADLSAAVSELAELDLIPLMLLPDLATDVTDRAATVYLRVSELRTALDDAEAKKAAEEAAAKAAAEAAAEAKRKAEEAAAALAAANTVGGAKATASRLAGELYGWGAGEFSCLESLWTKESGWNYQAYNASSGATGIPQSLPGNKMATAGADWQTNATTQIRWGLDYISRAYGTPCSAWAHSQATDWY